MGHLQAAPGPELAIVVEGLVKRYGPLQPLIDYLPLTPLVDAMRAVATQGESIAAHAGELLYLGAWAVAAAAVAVWRFRWE